MILLFESKSMNNHKKLMENWNKRGADRVKETFQKIWMSMDYLSLTLHLHIHPIAHWRVSTCPHNRTHYTYSTQDTLRNLILGFPLISERVDVWLTVCLFPFSQHAWIPSFAVISPNTCSIFPSFWAKLLLPLPLPNTLLFPLFHCFEAVVPARNVRDSEGV